MIRPLFLALALLCGVPPATGAGATEVHAGWLRSDVGLDGRGDGFTAGVGGAWALGDGPFDFAATGEYLRKRGSQPLMVANPEVGLLRADAEVTLDCLQPAAFVGYSVPLRVLRPRLYGGFSVSVKLSETWDRPAGATNRDYGYEDVDAAVHLGVQLRLPRGIFLDGRYNHGLLEQVVDRSGSAAAAKESDPLTGAALPVDGDTVDSWQVGLGVEF